MERKINNTTVCKRALCFTLYLHRSLLFAFHLKWAYMQMRPPRQYVIKYYDNEKYEIVVQILWVLLLASVVNFLQWAVLWWFSFRCHMYMYEKISFFSSFFSTNVLRKRVAAAAAAQINAFIYLLLFTSISNQYWNFAGENKNNCPVYACDKRSQTILNYGQEEMQIKSENGFQEQSETREIIFN